MALREAGQRRGRQERRREAALTAVRASDAQRVAGGHATEWTHARLYLIISLWCICFHRASWNRFARDVKHAR